MKITKHPHILLIPGDDGRLLGASVARSLADFYGSEADIAAHARKRRLRPRRALLTPNRALALVA